MKKTPNVVTRRIGEGTLLLPQRRVEEGLWAYELNETATFLWEELERAAGVGELAARLGKAFELPEEVALRDAEELVSDLRSLGVIE